MDLHEAVRGTPSRFPPPDLRRRSSGSPWPWKRREHAAPGGFRAAAAGVLEPAQKREQVHPARRGHSRCVRATSRGGSWWRSPTRASASEAEAAERIFDAFEQANARRSPASSAGWVWAWQSPRPPWRPTAARYAPAALETVRERPPLWNCHSGSLPPRQNHWTAEVREGRWNFPKD